MFILIINMFILLCLYYVCTTAFNKKTLTIDTLIVHDISPWQLSDTIEWDKIEPVSKVGGIMGWVAILNVII